jgi:hypothetical protein
MIDSIYPKALKSIFLFFALGLSAVCLMLSLSEVGLHQYLKYKADDYVKTTLKVQRFHYPTTNSGRPLSQHLMAHGTVDGVAVKIPLKSLLNKIRKLPREERSEVLMKEEKSVPIYKRKSDFTSMLFNGRSLRFVELDFFKNGSSRARYVFLVTLISSPVLFLWFRKEIRKRIKSPATTAP